MRKLLFLIILLTSSVALAHQTPCNCTVKPVAVVKQPIPKAVEVVKVEPPPTVVPKVIKSKPKPVKVTNASRIRDALKLHTPKTIKCKY